MSCRTCQKCYRVCFTLTDAPLCDRCWRDGWRLDDEGNLNRYDEFRLAARTDAPALRRREADR